jgi:DNA polymerase III delta prime subunit
MSYLVLARKYRPKTFEEVAGQEVATRVLQGAIREERIGHAYLFCGPRGTGKTTSARIFAKALNCERGPTPTPCGECERCLASDAGNEPDILEIDAASNRGIDEARARKLAASCLRRAKCRDQRRVVDLGAREAGMGARVNRVLLGFRRWPRQQVDDRRKAVAPAQVPEPVDAEITARCFAEQHGIVGAAREVGRQPPARGGLVLGHRRRVEPGSYVMCKQAPEVVLVVDDQNPD